MARGAAQARRKQPKPAPKRKRAAPTYEQTMFFPRLRRQAKWVFVFLALVFGVGFVAFGVGSGSTGISDILRGNFFGGGGSSTGSRIKADQKAIQRKPKDMTAYLDLAGIYQQENKEADAIRTLEQAAKVAPKNLDVLNRLALIYSGQAQRAVIAAQNAQIALSQNLATPPGLASGSPLGQAFSQDTYSQYLQSQLSQAQSSALTSLHKAERAYQRSALAAVGTSGEPGAQLQLASIAVQALQVQPQLSDLQIAIRAYKRYLKIAPSGVDTTQVRQTLAQLQSVTGLHG